MSFLTKYLLFFGRKPLTQLPTKAIVWILLYCGSFYSACQHSAVSTSTHHPLKEVFFANSPQETPALVYAFSLDTVQLDLIAGNKQPFSSILQDSSSKSYQLLMNAGMFHSNGSPVGLFYTTQLQVPLNEDKTSRGNFFMQPNGVFYLTKQNQAGILTTPQYKQQAPSLDIQLATQSGPMLLLEGKHHPAFSPSSNSQYIRNGVGITQEGTLLFILSLEPVNLHTFASFFLEKGCVNALYLDGAISGLYYNNGIFSSSTSNQSYGPVLGVLPQK